MLIFNTILMKTPKLFKSDKILIFLFFWNLVNFLYKKKINIATLHYFFEKFIWKKNINFFNKVNIKITTNTGSEFSKISKNHNKTEISFLVKNYNKSFKNSKFPQLFYASFLFSKYYWFSKSLMFFLTIHYKYTIDVFSPFNFKKSPQTDLIKFLNFQKTSRHALLKFNVRFL
jgi:hypothetical protein